MNKCNCCGREVPEHEVATFQYQYGYFTERDGDTLNLKLCPECLEIFTQKLIEECNLNPIEPVNYYCDADICVQQQTISNEEYLKAEGFEQCA